MLSAQKKTLIQFDYNSVLNWRGDQVALRFSLIMLETDRRAAVRLTRLMKTDMIG